MLPWSFHFLGFGNLQAQVTEALRPLLLNK